jgi:hypothetical protein
MWQLNYNIHDLLSIKIQGNGMRDPTRNLRYSYFATADDPAEPDIILNIGPFEPSHEGAEAIAHKYYVKENYFYCSEKGSGSNWKIEIFGFETGKTVINFTGGGHGLRGVVFPTFMAQEFLIPFIEYKLAKKNHFLIHSGAVCKDSWGYVLAGRGGVYKTSLIMDLMRTNDYQFLGDDRIILKKGGGILAFPRGQFVFDFTLNNTRTEERNAFDNFKLLVHALTNKTEAISTNPVANCSAIKKLIFVSRKTNHTIQTDPVIPQEALQRLITNNMAEYVESTKHSPIGQYNLYVQVYSLIFPDNDLQKHFDRMREGLKGIVMNTPMQEIILPFEYDQMAFNTLAKNIILER